MLFKQTVEPSTFSLLEKLVDLPSLKEFYLVGGTALALQIGHRNSIDLDLFSDKEYDQDRIMSEMPWEFEVLGRSNLYLGLQIEGTKVDIVKYLFPRITALIIEDGIPMASPFEIAGMKLWAITRRGTKKDFIDLYFLLKEISLEEMLDFFRKKFPNVDPLLVLRSLSYFGDADLEAMPEMFVDVEWEEMKATIQETLTKYVRNK